MPKTNDYNPNVSTDTIAVIAASGTTSAEVDLMGTKVVGVYIPATFTGTTLKFSSAHTAGGTSFVMQDGLGSDYTVTVATGKYIALDPVKFVGVRFLKIISGSTESAERSLVLATLPI
jgi:hypothetical protein